jgi:hypothetical protein
MTRRFKAILCVVLVLFAPGGCFAAIAAGACATGTTGNSAGLATPACNLSAGQLVYIACSNFGGTLTGTPVADSVGGNTWVQDGTTGSTVATSRISLFHSVLAAGGASMTVHCNYTAAVDSAVAIQNFTGAGTAGNEDGASNGSGTSTAPNSGSITPTQSGDVIVGASTHDSTPTTTKGTNFTESFKSDATSLAQPIELEYHIKTDSAAEAADWTLSASNAWVSVAGMFKVAGGASPTPSTDKRQKLERIDPGGDE